MSASVFDMNLIELPAPTDLGTSRKRRLHSDWKEAVFPPNKYFIGDIGHALSNRVYAKWNDRFSEGFFKVPHPDNNLSNLVFGVSNVNASWSTHSNILDNREYQYEIITGVIGIVPWELCAKKKIATIKCCDKDACGRIIDPKNPIKFEFCNGKFQITDVLTGEQLMYMDTDVCESTEDEESDDTDWETDSESDIIRQESDSDSDDEE